MREALPFPDETETYKKHDQRMFSNYIGIGVDSTVVGNFHRIREDLPGIFVHKAVNRLYYAFIGLFESMLRTCSDLHKRVKIRCDGVEYILDEGIEGIICSNIKSYAGGANLWEGPPSFATFLLDQNASLDESQYRSSTASSSAVR